MKLNVPRIDVDLASEGKWFPFTDTVSFKVAKFGNPAHKRALQHKFKQMQKYRDRGEFAQLERLTDELTVRCLFKDWRGLEEEGGKPLEYSHDAALSIICDPQYLGIKEFVSDCAASGDFDEEDEEDIVKN